MVVPKSDSYRPSSAKAAKASTATKSQKGKTAADAKKAENKKAQSKEDSKKAESQKQNPKYSLETEIQRLADVERQRASRATQKGATQQKQPSSKAAPAKTVDRTAAQAARVDRKVEGTGGAQAQSSAATKASASLPPTAKTVDRTAAQAARVQDKIDGATPLPKRASAEPTRGQVARVERMIDGPSPAAKAPPPPPPAANGGWSLQGVTQFITTTAQVVKSIATTAIHRHLEGAPVFFGQIDVAARIDELRNPGDSVTMVQFGSFKAVATVHPRLPIPVGGRGEYSHDCQVTQAAPRPGSAEPRYQVDCGKNLLGAADADFALPAGPRGATGAGSSIDPQLGAGAVAELGLASSDRVVMTFSSKNEAVQALRSYGRAADAETWRDLARLVVPTFTDGDPSRNPLRGPDTDTRRRSPPIPIGPLAANPVLGAVVREGLEAVAHWVGPSKAETTMLKDHVTAYREVKNMHTRGIFALGAQSGIPWPKGTAGAAGPGAAGGAFLPFGDIQPGFTKTVTLPDGDRPGSVSYSLYHHAALREAIGSRVQYAPKALGFMELAVEPYLVGDMARGTAQVEASWKLSDEEAKSVKASGGQTLPDLGLKRALNPDEMTVRLQSTIVAENPMNPFETDQVRATYTYAVKNPAEHMSKIAADGAMRAGIDLALNSQGTAEYSYLDRSGFLSWNEANMKVKAGGRPVLSVTGIAGMRVMTEKVTKRTTLEFPPIEARPADTRQAIAGSSGGPSEPPRGKSGDESGDADTSRSLPP